MDTTYWNLFWSTGMPEAWLMSRDGAQPARTPDGLPLGERQLLSGPMAGVQPHSDNSPGGPMGLY